MKYINSRCLREQHAWHETKNISIQRRTKEFMIVALTRKLPPEQQELVTKSSKSLCVDSMGWENKNYKLYMQSEWSIYWLWFAALVALSGPKIHFFPKNGPCPIPLYSKLADSYPCSSKNMRSYLGTFASDLFGTCPSNIPDHADWFILLRPTIDP